MLDYVYHTEAETKWSQYDIFLIHFLETQYLNLH